MKMEMKEQNILEEQLTIFGNWFEYGDEENEGIKDGSKVASQGIWKNESIM